MAKDWQVIPGRGGKGKEGKGDAPGDPTPVIQTSEEVPRDVAIKTVPRINGAQVVLAASAALLILYFGKLPIITILCSALIAFMLEPIVGTLERRMPRAAGAGIALLLVLGGLYLASYYSWLQAKEFASNFPKYSQQLKEQVIRFRKEASKLEATRQAIIPDAPETKDAVKVRSVDGPASTPGRHVTEIAVAISFVPFLVYFMLTWQEHTRASLVQLFRREDRTTAYVALSHISKMLRAFIVGNFIIGLVTAIASAALFWYLQIPYWYFVGLLSGFLSLIPYLGVPLAMVPPLFAGVGVLKPAGFAMVVAGVVILHLIALNVLYPKILGKRLQLNPLAVTVSLLVWGFLWGGVGLVLAVPITAAMKIVFEHIDSLQPLSHLLGEGEAA